MTRMLTEIIDAQNLKSQILEENDAFGNVQKSCYILGPFMVSEDRNKNGRIYKKHVIEREIKLFTDEKVANNRAGGELNHPETPLINLERISHYITELQMSNNVCYGKAKLANTPMGKIAQTLVGDGYQLGVSSRGLGDVSDDGCVSEDFKLVTVDLVSEPSANNAFVEALMENRRNLYGSCEYYDSSFKNLSNALDKKPAKNSEKYITEAIVGFINSLKGAKC